MIRPLRELPEVLDAARMTEPTLEAGLLHHRDGVRMLTRDLPAFGPTVVHRTLLAQLTHSASRIVSPTTAPLVDAAADWTRCPCAEHADDLSRAAEDSAVAPHMPLVALFVDVADGTRPLDPDVLAEGFDLAAHMSGTLLVVDTVIAELRAWVRADPRAASMLNERDEALHAAATAGDAEAVQALLSSLGVTPSTYYQLAAEDHAALQSALLTGVRLHHHDVVTALLEAGVPTWSHAPSPLSELRAWDREDIPLVQLLVRHNARPEGNLSFEHPVHDAAAKGWTGTVKALLAHGGDVDGRDGDGRTALHLAAVGNHRDLVDLLLRFGASPLAVDRAGNRPDELASGAIRTVIEAAGREAAARPRPHDSRPLVGVAIVDDATIVTSGRHDLHRWDVRDPLLPELVDHTHLDHRITRAIVLGDRVLCIGQGSARPLPDFVPESFPQPHDIGVEARALAGLRLVTRVDVTGVCADSVAALSPDGRLLAVGAQYALALLDAETLAHIADGAPGDDIEQVCALAFHPSGRYLVAITSDIYGDGAAIDVLPVKVLERGFGLGPRVTMLPAPKESLRDERWHGTRLAFDDAGTALYLFGGEGTGRGRIHRLDWSADSTGAPQVTPRWWVRGDDLLVIDDSTLLVQTEPLYLHVLDAADASVLQEIELDRPMPFPMVARDSTGRVWIVGHGGLTFTDALRD